jgi:hypothetical protein
MIEYIYIVKCPKCEDEHFHFFDEAKACAMGYLSDKPVITQVEVERNDFGECTDSHDLGTVWSWEEVMKDIPAELAPTFTKDEIVADYNPEEDPEFDNTDDFQINESTDEVPMLTWTCWYDGNDIGTVEARTEEDAEREMLDKFGSEYFFDSWDHDFFVSLEESKRKPVPGNMTIEELVEEMEDHEDTVECKWCDELFNKNSCRKEDKLGWLCNSCVEALKSRGEPLTFKENDFLDESVSLEEAYNFKYLELVDDAKTKIIDELKKNVANTDYGNEKEIRIFDKMIEEIMKKGMIAWIRQKQSEFPK